MRDLIGTVVGALIIALIVIGLVMLAITIFSNLEGKAQSNPSYRMTTIERDGVQCVVIDRGGGVSFFAVDCDWER